MMKNQRSLNRIVYVDLKGRIATINPDGTDNMVLTGTQRIFQFPAWSPTETHVVAVGNNENGGGLYVFGMEGNPMYGTTEIYYSHRHMPFYHYWSPDGRFISFLTTDPNGFGLRIASLERLRSQLIATGQPLFWMWADPRNSLFVHAGGSGELAPRLAFLTADGKKWGENIAQPGYFNAPGISTNGRFWSYAILDENEKPQLIVEDSETRQQRAVIQKGMLALTWSPTEPKLAFTSPNLPNMQPHGPLFVFDVEKNHTYRLVDDSVLAFFWAPDGRHIAYLTLAKPDSKQILTLDHTMFTNGVVPHSMGHYFDDDTLTFSLHVVTLETKSSRRLIDFSPPPTFVNQYLPFFDQYALSHRLWSPDSSSIVLPHVTDDTAVLKVVPLNGDPARELVEGFMPSWSQH